jgi:hypothetical protein
MTKNAGPFLAGVVVGFITASVLWAMVVPMLWTVLIAGVASVVVFIATAFFSTRMAMFFEWLAGD